MRNMYCKIFLFFSLLFTNIVYAQEIKLPDALLNKMSDDCCVCMKEIDITKASSGETQKQVESCIMKVFGVHVPEIMEHLNGEELNEETGKKIGVELAKVMFKSCPTFATLSVKMAQDKNNLANEKELEGNVIGKVKRIETKEFAYLIVEDENKRELSFIWLSYFPGSEQLTQGPEHIKGQKVKVAWQEKEFYLPQMKGYYKIKEITNVDFLSK